MYSHDRRRIIARHAYSLFHSHPLPGMSHTSLHLLTKTAKRLASTAGFVVHATPNAVM